MGGLGIFVKNTIIWVFTMQISIFLHELGHCFAILAFTKGDAIVTLGHGENEICFSLRRLHVHLRAFAPWVGYMFFRGVVLTKRLSLLTSLGGPLVSLIIGTAAFFFRSYVNEGFFHSVLSVAILFNWVLFLVTAIPIVYPKWWVGYAGMPSDGYRVFKLVTSKKSTP